MKYHENGDLHSYIDKAKGMLCWKDIIVILWEISGGIEHIHKSELIHVNLHGGNLLVENEHDSVYIVDMELYGPANKKISNQIYGVVPYVAPEILKGNPPTKASDIYSFGIILWIISAGIRPWCNRPHDLELATEICFGLRPEIIDGTPNAYIQLMTRCWNSNPTMRPTAAQLYDILGSWVNAICDDPNPSELSHQFDVAEEKKILYSEQNQFHRQIHPQAFYTSRHLYFPSLIGSTRSDE
ncbi:2205_t:CDS:1 [Funneliformis geosporum]|uniref:non-specific serine/threonine protein kinase n=1 Tax=Funneliformis geosporum TaxID=1117311 RepID=A0A9W4SB68_9GLOM|nr:2205_t:CDS:1 [Funneliformis geosporum]